MLARVHMGQPTWNRAGCSHILDAVLSFVYSIGDDSEWHAILVNVDFGTS